LASSAGATLLAAFVNGIFIGQHGRGIPTTDARLNAGGSWPLPRRVLTALGIKPVGPVQWSFQSFYLFYLYGAVEPLSGENFFLEFSHLSADSFQLLLNKFSKAYPHSLNVIQLDNGRFHSAKKLTIPDNVVLLFQPPYSSDVNPIERVWQFMRDKLCWINLKTLDELRKKVDEIIQSILPSQVASLTSFDFILSALK